MADPSPLSVLDVVGDGLLPGPSREFLVRDVLWPSDAQNLWKMLHVLVFVKSSRFQNMVLTCRNPKYLKAVNANCRFQFLMSFL